MDINSIKPSSFDSFSGAFGSASSMANGAMSLLDGLFDISGKRQEKHQKNLMAEQQKYWDQQHSALLQDQLDQWNRENEYNDPTNYYKRLFAGADANGITKQAALSGDLPGSVGISSHNPTPASGSGVSAPGGSALHPLGDSVSLSNLRQRSEIANIDALTNYYNKQSGLADAQTITELNRSSFVESSTRLNDVLARKGESETSLTDLQRIYQDLSNNNYQRLTDAQIDALEARADHDFKAAEELISRRDLTDAETTRCLAETIYLKQLTALQIAYTRLANNEADITGFDRDILERNLSQYSQSLKDAWESISVQLDQGKLTRDHLPTSFLLQDINNIVGPIVQGLTFGFMLSRGGSGKSSKSSISTIERYNGDGVLTGVVKKY